MQQPRLDRPRLTGHGTTTRRLAARLGVQSPTLYWHLPNKAALVTRGVPLRQARVIILTIERFTVGHVLEEQGPRPDAEALKTFDMDAFPQRHPTAIAEYLEPGRTVDDLFHDCLSVVIAGASVTTENP